MRVLLSLAILGGIVVGIFFFFLWIGGISPLFLVQEFSRALRAWIKDKLGGAGP